MDGATVSKDKLDYAAKKPTHLEFGKDILQILWRPDDLINCSATGEPCRRFLKAANKDTVSKTALTIEKLEGLMCEFTLVFNL